MQKGPPGHPGPATCSLHTCPGGDQPRLPGLGTEAALQTTWSACLSFFSPAWRWREARGDGLGARWQGSSERDEGRLARPLRGALVEAQDGRRRSIARRCAFIGCPSRARTGARSVPDKPPGSLGAVRDFESTTREEPGGSLFHRAALNRHERRAIQRCSPEY